MTNRPRRSARQATVLGIAACALLVACTAACSRQAADLPVQRDTTQAGQDSGFLVPEAGSLVLMLGHDGQLEPISESSHELPLSLRQGPVPAPFAIQTAIAAIQTPSDTGAIIAINRWGLMHLTVHGRQVQMRSIEGAASEFAGRTVAQAWTWNGQAMFLLHRNEIFESEAARTPAARIIAVTEDGLIALPGFESFTETAEPEVIDLYGAPYALFPRARDHWLVQFRLVGPERTRTAFAAWNPNQNQFDPLERSGYESAVKPAPLTEAPGALRRTAERLEGSLIMDAVMPDGSQQTWIRGNADTMLAIRAIVFDETTALSLTSTGRLIRVASDGVSEYHIKPPVPQAYFRDLVLLDGFIIVVWEEDLFPNVGRSGLVIIDADRAFKALGHAL